MKSVIDLANQVKKYAAAGKTIADVENGTTAVGSYAIGEQFIREGVLYKAKTAITAGDTLTLNTNYELDDPVMEQFNSQKQALSNYQNYYGSKNILSFARLATVNPFVQNNITYTFHEDTGIINIVSNGTSSGLTSPYVYLPTFDKNTDVIVSVEGIDSTKNDYLVYDYTAATTLINGTTEQTVTIPANHIVGISVRSFSDKTFNEIVKPMIRVCGDNTFVPYVPTNAELLSYKDNGILGAKNFVPFPTLSELKEINTSGSWNGNVYTYGAATFTVNESEKTVTVNCDGTGSSGSTYFSLYNRLSKPLVLKNGNYIANGLPDGITENNKFIVNLNATTKNATTEAWNAVVTNDAYFTYNDSAISGMGLSISVVNSTVISNKKFSPMIRLASDTDPTYQPYAMTNKELTDATNAINKYISIESAGASNVKDVIQIVFNTVIPLLSDLGKGANGSVHWTGHANYGFVATKVEANEYQAMMYRDTKLWSASYNSSTSTLTVYEYTGTVVS